VLDVLLLALQVITLILLFLFIWWVVRSARGDLVAGVRGPQPTRQAPEQDWDRGSQQWPAPAGPPGTGVTGEWHGEPDVPAAVADWAAPATAAGTAGFEWSDRPAVTPSQAAPIESVAASPPAADEKWEDTGRPSRADVSAPFPPAAPASSQQPSPPAPTGVSAAASHGPASAGAPRLLVESSPILQPGMEISLERSVGVGRSPDSDLVLDDPFVSSTHARIVRRDHARFVEDLGSTNGTFVNERAVTEARLTPETRLRIGETVFRYQE